MSNFFQLLHLIIDVNCFFYFIHSHIVRQPKQIRKEEKQWQGQEKTSTKGRMEDGKQGI